MSLIDEIKIKSLSDAQEILKAAGTEDIFEKAHKDGDLHPNGKWVWVSSANGGRGDWRTLNGRTHKKHQAANAAGGGSSSASSTTGGNSSSVKTTISDGGKKKMINAKTNVKVVPDTYTIRGNRSSRKMDALYKEMDEKYKDYSREDLQKLKDSFDKKRTIGLAIDRYKQLTKQGASKIAINKEGNLCDELTARYYTINRLLATEDVTNDVDNSKTTSSINPTFQKYFSINNSKFTDPKKMSVSKTPQGNWSLSYEGKRISTVAPLTDADKKELESAGVTFDDTFKPKQKVKTNSETYSHDINGVSVNVSKNKDGSYTLEANGKKVKSDDPSFFKDKLTTRVKKALAKEVGIDAKNSTKQFDVKEVEDFISSIKTAYGDIRIDDKDGAILLGKRGDYIGEFDRRHKRIELGQYSLSDPKRDRELIKEVSSVLKKKFGLSKKTEYQDHPQYGKKVYMTIILKPSE